MIHSGAAPTGLPYGSELGERSSDATPAEATTPTRYDIGATGPIPDVQSLFTRRFAANGEAAEHPNPLNPPKTSSPMVNQLIQIIVPVAATAAGVALAFWVYSSVFL